MISKCQRSKLTVKLKQTFYRHVEALRVPESLGSQISRGPANKGVRLPTPATLTTPPPIRRK
jgi:hypothetical protein